MDGVLDEVENEWHIVRHSGETPEIAYNSAIYYLTRAKDGPHLLLDEQQLVFLKEAAVERYLEIILRDLLHDNCGKSLYRGIERSIVNYHRFCTYCARQQLPASVMCYVQGEAARALALFLDTESKRLQNENALSVINCSYADLQKFAGELGVQLNSGHRILEKHCQPR